MRLPARRLLLVLAALAGCGGSAALTKGSAANAGTPTAAPAPPAQGRDECAHDRDCPPIECLVAPCPPAICALGDDGLLHCGPLERAPGPPCTPVGGRNECEGDDDCTQQPRGVCGPRAPRRCLYGPCRTNADCTRAPGGTCVLDEVGAYCPEPKVFCRYPGDPCRQDSDCKGASRFGLVCVPNDDLQGQICKDRGPPPP
jgi:hypothetical protein